MFLLARNSLSLVNLSELYITFQLWFVYIYIEIERERKVCLQYKIIFFMFIFTNTVIYFIW